MGITLNTFSVDVNWAGGDVWYQAYLDIGSGMVAIGAKQKFMTVPYAFYAENVPVIATGSVLTIGTTTVPLNSGPNYVGGSGISISGSTIAAVSPTITGTGGTTVGGSYPLLTINSPTVQSYSAGAGINISGGVISNTAAPGALITGTIDAIPVWTTTNTLGASNMSQNVGGGILITNAITPSAAPRLRVKSNDFSIIGEDMSGVHSFGVRSNIGPVNFDGVYIGAVTGSDLHFFTGGALTSTVMVLQKLTNRLGLGTNIPTSKFHVYTNSAGEDGIFSEAGIATTTNAIRGTTFGTGNAAFFRVYNSTSSAKAVEAISNNTVSTISTSNINPISGDALKAVSNNGRAIYAINSSTTGYATIETMSNSGALALLATKNVVSGSVVSFQNSNVSNPSPVLDISNFGQGAAVKLSTSVTSTLALLIDEGHIKSTGTAVTTGTAAISGGFTSFSSPTILPNSNDVKGAFSFIVSGSALAPGSFTEQEIRFSKAYSSIPVVVVSPLVDLQGLNFMISSISTLSFSVRIYQTSNTSIALPTSIIASLFKFNYVVIE